MSSSLSALFGWGPSPAASIMPGSSSPSRSIAPWRSIAACSTPTRGAYGDSRSIEDCTDELGWQQLIYVDRSGGRKALFPKSEDSFYFGPGYLIPGPIEGTITFLGAMEGRAGYLMVEQAGSEPEIARRSDSGAVRSRNLRGCSPLRANMKAGRSG